MVLAVSSAGVGLQGSARF